MKTKFILLFTLFLCSTYTVFSSTYYVRSSGGLDTNDGLSESTAFQTLDKVFGLTLTDGDIVDISGTFDYYVGKTLTKSITIQGGNKTTAIIQGFTGSKKRCFGIGDASNLPTITIENITFQNFDYFDEATSTIGGVINVTAGSSLICRNVSFLNNQAYSGGAITNAGTATFEDCYFYGNKTIRRSAAANADGGAINVSVSAGDVSLIVKRCLFEANSSQNLASAVRFKSTSTGTVNLLIENSTFFGNTVKTPSTSPSAGCVYLDVVAGNTVKVINNTIAFNTSEVNNTSARAGVSVAGIANQVILINNILYSNTNAASTNISIAAGVKMKESRNNITNQNYDFVTNTTASMATDNVISVTDVDFGLAAILADNGGATKTLTIGANSVAKNTGYATGAPAVDQRGFGRIGSIDIGAVEVNTTIGTGTETILSSNTQLDNVVVAPGAKLTLNNSTTLNSNSLALQSDVDNGTATFVDLNPTGGLTVSGTTNVFQYISSTQTGVNGRNWYISSPLSAALSSTITTATGNGLVYYDGTTNWPAAGTTMDIMKGYIAKSPAHDATIEFTGGTLNTGAKSVTNLPLGFNLVGNPYPSYLNWVDATKTGIATSIWYRSKRTGSYLFQTYNVNGEGVGTNGGSELIPPMQSFWVKATNATNELGFTNAMRSHQDQTVTINRLKAPKASTQQLLRLQLNNGTANDEAVVYFNQNAQNTLDAYDSQKMFVNLPEVAELYTLLGTDKLVINGMSTMPENVEIPLGIVAGSATSFSLKVTEMKNFETGTQIILKDNFNGNTQDLSDGSVFNFDNSLPATNRFALIFRAPGVTTALSSINKNDANALIFSNANNQIVVNCNTINAASKVAIFSAIGQKIMEKLLTNTITLMDNQLKPGVYFVTVSNGMTTTTQKIILK